MVGAPSGEFAAVGEAAGGPDPLEQVGRDVLDDGHVGGAVSGGLERQEVVAAARTEGLGDGGPGADGVDADQGSGRFEPPKKRRDGGDLVRLVMMISGSG